MSTAGLTLWVIYGAMVLITVITLVVLNRRIDKQSAKEMQEIDKKLQEFLQSFDESQATDYESEDD